MKIGIDISQIVYEGTGISRYVRELVRSLITRDSKTSMFSLARHSGKESHFILFYKSLGKNPRIRLVVIPLPPTVLDFLWNVLHILPIEFLSAMSTYSGAVTGHSRRFYLPKGLRPYMMCLSYGFRKVFLKQ